MELKSPKSLARIVGSNLSELKKIIDNIDQYYRFDEIVSIKNDGRIKKRPIEPSIGKLKTIQERILKLILEEISISSAAHGGVKTRDTITNAKVHLGKNYHFCTDIKKFYPSVRYQRVCDILILNGFSPPVSKLITQLTTYKGRLPQGTSTSSYLANLVFSLIDKELVNFCKIHDIHYTRYVDDLIFSSQKCFKNKQDVLIKIITREPECFRINHRKTLSKWGPIEITGILVRQNKIELTDEKIKKLNSDMTDEKRKGFENYVKQVRNYKKK